MVFCVFGTEVCQVEFCNVFIAFFVKSSSCKFEPVALFKFLCITIAVCHRHISTGRVGNVKSVELVCFSINKIHIVMVSALPTCIFAEVRSDIVGSSAIKTTGSNCSIVVCLNGIVGAVGRNKTIRKIM